MQPDLQGGPEGLRVAVVGGGSWGTTLANLLAEKGLRVELWVFEPEVAEQIRTLRENRLFLPGVALAPNLNATTNLPQAVADKELVVVVVPSHVLRATTAAMAGALGPSAFVVSASKGIENRTYLTMTGVLRETLGLSDLRLGVLSGPSFAAEVARRMPTTVTVASRNPELARQVQAIFATPFFRVYTHADVTGVELGGSVKNVIAIAAGIVDGLGFGLNTRAALITRGMTEIRRLGIRLGANPRTFTGLAGYGDLILTCTGNLSRNHTLGYRIGRGERLAALLAGTRSVAEGVHTSESVYNLSRQLGVEMPICHQTYRILYEELPPKEALFQLMSRNLKAELDDE
ncbi:MAG: NAD(P)-dependent glycerol-3-phosphate dehydrogenase [Desulfobacterales bacterium]|jgi:glycerol-3-phosphate dehydrogenase (NAD(P)+)|nr:NAD(P)-dependent glycerol-3-phosphate dehydrogenase [Desulfobacterales bacterium]